MKKIIIWLTILGLVGIFGLAASAQNVSTLVSGYSSTWSRAKQDQSVVFGAQAGGVLVATYSFNFDGAAATNIDLDVYMPSNAVVYDGIIDVITPVEPHAATNTVRLTLETGGDVLAATTNLGYAAGFYDTIPAGTAATAFQTTARRQLTMQTAGATPTGGVFKVFLVWFQSFAQ